MPRRGDQRGLTTLLFTDVVGSSDVLVELDDRRWKVLQARHQSEVRKQLKRYRGHEVDTAGDGFFATFGRPADGVRCASAIVERVRELGLDIRAGLHCGEAELTGEKVSGIAVTTAARVSGLSQPGQVLATETMVHLVAGSGLRFSSIGPQRLKGVPGEWELFALDTVDGQRVGVPLDADQARKARDRSSPPQVPTERSRRAASIGVAVLLVALLAGGFALSRDRSGTDVTPPAPGPAPVRVVALAEGSGDVAFPVDLPPLRVSWYSGPIVMTGRVDTPTSFSWVPSGIQSYDLTLAQVNRSTGVVVDAERTFGTQGTTCVCVASAAARLWTPIGTAYYGGLGTGTGTSLRGIDPEGEDDEDIVVDASLAPGGISALVAGGGYVWLGDSLSHVIYRIDPSAGIHGRRRVEPVSLRQSADELLFADGRLWVLDASEGEISRIDPDEGVSRPIPVVGELHGMSVGGGYVWVTDSSGDAVERIPEDLGSVPTEIPVGGIGGTPSVVAYDHGAIVVGFHGGAVAKIDPSDPTSPTVVWFRSVGNNVSAIAIDHAVVWAAGGPLSNY